MSGERSEPGLVPSRTTLKSGGFVVKFGDVAFSTLKRVKRLRSVLWGSAHWLSLAAPGHRAPQAHMVTLTYRDARGWAANHMRDAVDLYRRWCRFRKVSCRYAWVAEIQDGTRKESVHNGGVVRGRGAVHYHLMVWLPQGMSAPMFDKPQRIGARTTRVLWPWGMTQREPARAGVGYLMKYVSKGNREGFQFPRGLRVFGLGGLCDAGKAIKSWLTLPEWAKRDFGVGELARCAGRLVVRASGELLESPWVRTPCPGGVLLQCTRELGPRWFSGPYSAVRFE